MSTNANINRIKDVFDKERDPLRELNTVIKVDDFSERSVWIEFEEFVLTDALIQNFWEFYNDFTATIEFDGPKMPYWLEGFYGSGKSHFSKMIGYLLQNANLKDQNGKAWGAIDFFTQKILKETKYKSQKTQKLQHQVLETLPLYPKQFNCKTIFINLSKYSKSENTAENFMESFTIALLKEFNHNINLADSIEIAEVEKNLIQEKIFDDFKLLVNQQQKKPWEEVRKSGPWARRSFIDAYTQLTKCDSIIASEYLKGAESDCKQKTPDKVLQEINDWIESNLSQPEKGIQGKMLFILDEAGLFFSAKASRIGEMMAVAEWIHNPMKKARINMIFNAQQSIKTYFESVKADVDYRTAEQRFKHWFLDKKNIKTVVVKRWLKKDVQKGEQNLKITIDADYPKIIDGSLMDTLKDPNLEYIKPTREEIYDTYPFLPYQFPLMIQISQALITEKIVEEQFGGKTRSILSMTRDVLNNKTRFSKHLHFVEESLGSFVTLPQIYDCVTFTLKKKEEDQFILVDSSLNLVEDPNTFSQEERDLPFSFFEVMKVILILKYVEEIYSSDQNIARSLFNSLSCNRALYIKKVKKLIEILKQRGYISYQKREIEDEQGKKKEIWEYKIASQEEKKWIEKSHSVIITEDDIQKRLVTFFTTKEGQNLIQFKDQFYVNKLLDELEHEYTISNPVKLRCVWEIDPKWDKIEGKFANLENQIQDLDHDKIMIVIISPKTLGEFQKDQRDLKKLEMKIQTLAAKSLMKQKLVLVVCPSFTVSIDKINANKANLEYSLKECIRIDKTCTKDQNLPGNILQSFRKRVDDIEKDILELLEIIFNEGAIYYGNKLRIRISKDNINAKIQDITKELFSLINNKAYLGQIKPSTTDIVKLLTWDPKKKSEIPVDFRISKKSPTEALFLFNENGTELNPNYAPQIALITQEFEKLLQKDPDCEMVSGEQIKTIFQRPPYNWSDQTFLACIAALLRHNEWDVLKGAHTHNCNDNLILNSFKDGKKDYEQFRELKFKVAERLTQEQMGDVNTILNDLFNEGITKIGPELLNEKILSIAQDINEIYTTIKTDITKLNLQGDCLDNILTLHSNMEQIKKSKRNVERIQRFLTVFQPFKDDATKGKIFANTKQTFYRIAELKQSNQLDRYYWLDEFNTKILKDWLTGVKNRPELDITHLEKLLHQTTHQIHDPEYLFEEKWNTLWMEEQELWNLYWQEYHDLHESLIPLITQKVQQIESHLNFSRFGKLEKDKLRMLKQAFVCKFSPQTPSQISSNQFTCPQCNSNFSRLQVIKLADIEKIYQELITWLDNLNTIEISEKNPANPVVIIAPPVEKPPINISNSKDRGVPVTPSQKAVDTDITNQKTQKIDSIIAILQNSSASLSIDQLDEIVKFLNEMVK